MPYDQYSWPILTAIIANGASLSGIVDTNRLNAIGIIMPAGWTAASLTFQGSIDGTNFFNLYDQAGNEVTVPVAASNFVVGLDVLAFGSFNYLRIRSGTSGTPVNQGAERVFTIVARNAK